MTLYNSKSTCFKIILLFVFSEFSEFVESARILGVIPTPSISHQVVFRPIWRELAKRGHDVTVISTDPMNEPNIKEIDLHMAYDVAFKKNNLSDVINSYTNIFAMMDEFVRVLLNTADEELSVKPIKDMIANETEYFDLVMVEFHMPVFLALAKRFKAPLIGLSSMDVATIGHQAFGNPTHPVIYPEFSLPFVNDLTLVERVISTLYSVYIRYYSYYHFGPKSDKIIEKHFGSGYPPAWQMASQADMLFLNVNPILHTIRPNLPTIIEYGGGFHLDKPKTLPKDLKKFLDDGKEGVVYFSLGSNAKSKDIKAETIDAIVQAFREMPSYRFLWKFEIDDLPDISSNVKIQKWLPQQDILNHPNVKVFITQGGIQSIDEAVFNYVPMIGMPIFADQEYNVKKFVSKGMGLFIDKKSVTKEELITAINEVMNNNKYRERVQELAKLALDQPISGLDKVIWWTEYVIRHKGAKHLRSNAIDVPDYKFFLLDVIAVVTLIPLFIICIIIYLIRVFIRKLCKTRKYKMN